MDGKDENVLPLESSIGEAATKSTHDTRPKRRSSTRRLSFNRHSSCSTLGFASANPCAWKHYQNMRRGMKERFEAAKKELAKTELELGFDSNELVELYEQVKSLECSLGTEGDVLEEELLAILAEPESLVDQSPLKKARLDHPQPICIRSPVTEVARRLEEWSEADGIQEMLKAIAMDPLEGLHKPAREDLKCSSSTMTTVTDPLALTLACIQTSNTRLAALEAQRKAALVKQRVTKLRSLPSHVTTVERLANRLAGAVI
ncbi:hypothetical protein BIW11_00856 [Tropilaelaps mercedesae]|uniref:Uncharacterized protein n=1 Tax=Tropilaelaps mercedesae TaxID=418985 RepID=A0A1V9XNG2_9ACAR|nr:hypothetical protein BIW11_00856 [Tropilaelaps mercedesae]